MYTIQLLEIDYPNYYGVIDGKEWGARPIRYRDSIIFKVLPEYRDDFNRNERAAISRFLYIEAEIANNLNESNEENIKKRMSILEALKEIPDIEEGDCGSMYEEEEEEREVSEKLFNESRNWDKFTKDLIKRERNNLRDAKNKRIDENSPQRKYNKRYREDWRNSTRWAK